MSEHHHCDCEHGHDHEANIYEQAFAKYDLNLNDEKVAQDVRELVANHREQYNTPEVLRTLLSTVELTTLTVTDSHENVLRFTESVNRWSDQHPDLPPLATICVYPNFAATVSQNLQADGVRVACVSGGFPASQTFIEVRRPKQHSPLKMAPMKSIWCSLLVRSKAEITKPAPMKSKK